jgi:chemotaxis protein MotA
MDLTTLGGLVVGIAGILLGQALEGGHVGSILQDTAAIIVFAGTIGAVMVAFPKKDFVRGLKLCKLAFTEPKDDLPALSARIVELATVARRDGVLALEGQLASIEDPFLRRALGYVVDGVDAAEARSSLEASIDAEHQADLAGAKVWEAAGGFSPTIGIIGAVLGLIHVMENLSDPSKLGGGIAVAFVATVYGVATANLFYLPVATKLKRKLTLASERKGVITEGVLGIQEGLNPRVLEEKLRALTGAGHGASAAAEPRKKAA